MNLIDGIFGREIRVSDERLNHILENHPEMEGQLKKIEQTLLSPEIVVKSNSDVDVNL